MLEEYKHRFLSSNLDEMYEPHVVMNTLHQLISECQELNQWQTIDENTPKDRRILLHFKCSFGGHKGKTQVGIFNEVINLYIPLDSHGYSDDYIREYQPTHWQELPADPELPEPPK